MLLSCVGIFVCNPKGTKHKLTSLAVTYGCALFKSRPLLHGIKSLLDMLENPEKFSQINEKYQVDINITDQ